MTAHFTPLLASFSAARRSRGVVLIYAAVAFVPIAAILSLAIDFGHAQLVRTQMQNSADAIALGVMDAYLVNGWNGANTAAVTCPNDNVVDAGSGVAPTANIIGGTWYAATRSFVANDYSGTPAVRVMLTRTQAAGNGVRVVWGSFFGRTQVDVRVMSIAVRGGGATTGVTVPATASLHLSGMPAGSTTRWGDDTTDATPYRIVGIPVTPGQWLSFDNFSGTSSIYPAGGVGYYGAAGNSAMPLHHGQNYTGSPNSPGPENGIADAVLPASAVTGLFLGDDAPNTTAAPAAVDWTQPAKAAQTVFSDLQVKQPFLIGDGHASGGAVRRFQVPPGATRMYMSVWDGVQQNNNGGSVSGTVTTKYYAYLTR